MGTYIAHSESSVKKFGGKVEDYIKIHKLMDSSKFHQNLYTHRIFSHNTWFVEVLCELLGEYITNSDNKSVLVRDICYQHLEEDHGKVPTIKDWCSIITLERSSKTMWINNPKKLK